MTSLYVSTPEVKHCPGCGDDKPIDAFYRQRGGVLGRQRVCKACDNRRRGNPFPSTTGRIFAAVVTEEPITAPNTSATPPGHDPRWPRWAHPLARHLATGPASVVALIGQSRGLGIGATKALNVIAWLENERLTRTGPTLVHLTASGLVYVAAHRPVGICRQCEPCIQASGDRLALRREARSGRREGVASV